MATRWIRLSLAAGILTAWVALSGTAVAAAPAVTISGQAFEPPTLKVAVGATVSWTNLDFAGHTVTGTAWDTGTLALGESGQTTFDEAGSFTYFCRIHPAMVGTIEVSAAAARVKHDDGTVPPVTASPTRDGPSGVVVGAILALTAVVGMRVATRRFDHARASA